MNKKLTIGLAFLLAVATIAPMSVFAQSVDQSTTCQLTAYQCLLQQVIGLLVQEVAQLEAQLTAMQNGASNLTIPQPQFSLGMIGDATSTQSVSSSQPNYTPSPTLQTLQSSTQQLSTIPPATTNSSGQIIGGATPAIPSSTPSVSIGNINLAFNNCLNSIPSIGTITLNGWTSIVITSSGNTDSGPTTSTYPISFSNLMFAHYNPKLTLTNDNGKPEIISDPSLMSDFSESSQSVIQNYGVPQDGSYSLNITNMPTFPYYCSPTSAYPAGVEIE